MIQIIYTLLFVGVLSFVWTFFFGFVDTLPWGLDAVMVSFVEQVWIIIHIFPPLETVWDVVLIGMTVKLAMLAMTYAMYVIHLLKA